MEKEPIREKRLSVSEMAQIHGLSRQTLIYYDRIGLFKPYFVEQNGYRFYSPVQIPKLREICFLRSIGMPIDEIKKHNLLNSSISTLSLLAEQKARLEEEISTLNTRLELVNDRIDLYNKSKKSEIEPYIKVFPDRYLVSYEITGKPSRENFLVAITNVVDISEKASILPSSLYGTLFREESVKSGTPLKNACACFVINESEAKKLLSCCHLGAGEYLCAKKYGMSYQLSALNRLLKKMDEMGYETAGDIYEESLMDGGLYDNPDELDFSEIQIPVKPKA